LFFSSFFSGSFNPPKKAVHIINYYPCINHNFRTVWPQTVRKSKNGAARNMKKIYYDYGNVFRKILAQNIEKNVSTYNNIT